MCLKYIISLSTVPKNGVCRHPQQTQKLCIKQQKVKQDWLRNHPAGPVFTINHDFHQIVPADILLNAYLEYQVTEKKTLSTECCLGRDEGSSNWAILRELQLLFLQVSLSLQEAAIARKVNDIKKLASNCPYGGCTCQP